MSGELKLLRLFEKILGNKYKIVPLSDDKKNGRDRGVVEENADSANDSDILDNEFKYVNIDGHGVDDGEDTDEGEDTLDVSEEAKALFERDKRKYGISIQRAKETTRMGDQKLIDEAQEAYDWVVRYLDDKIRRFNGSKEIMRRTYIDILKNGDKNDPYRTQLADVYSPEYARQLVRDYERIKRDPFYGRFKLLSQDDGRRIDIYVGRFAFKENDLLIVSPWSDFGKAFRQNRSSFRIKGKNYEVVNKYKYITKNGKIIGVKDESPR